MKQKYKDNIKFLLDNCIGKTPREIDNVFPVDSGRTELMETSYKDRGRRGKWFEWIITGKQGDTESKPDLGTIDIKTCMPKSGNISITNLGYDKWNIPFAQSDLKGKLKIIAGVFNNTKEDKLIDIIYLDLNQYSEIEEGYKVFQTMAGNGEEFHVGSSGTFLKFKTGSSSNVKYKDKNNIERVQQSRRFGISSSKALKIGVSLTKTNIEELYENFVN